MTEDLPESEQTQATNHTSPLEAEATPEKCAYINDEGVFLGMVDYPAPEEVTPNHLLTINKCDLALGQYIWDDNAKTFLPIKARRHVAQMAADAIESGIKLLQRNNQEVPLEVLIWLQQLKKV